MSVHEDIPPVQLEVTVSEIAEQQLEEGVHPNDVHPAVGPLQDDPVLVLQLHVPPGHPPLDVNGPLLHDVYDASITPHPPHPDGVHPAE